MVQLMMREIFLETFV